MEGSWEGRRTKIYISFLRGLIQSILQMICETVNLNIAYLGSTDYGGVPDRPEDQGLDAVHLPRDGGGGGARPPQQPPAGEGAAREEGAGEG